jgi:hypothetical protein
MFLSMGLTAYTRWKRKRIGAAAGATEIGS